LAKDSVGSGNEKRARSILAESEEAMNISKYILSPILVLVLVVSTDLKAQNSCDSVEIVSVTYTPFSDTAIQVLVSNSSSDIFSYPGFILFDQNGDTLAQEMVNFFGIGTESAHQLSFKNGVTPPIGSFNGTLELWTGFYSQLACSWSMVFDLCPTDSCTAIQVNIGNFGGALINDFFDWIITDTLMNTLASGIFHLYTTQQSDYDTVCLQPGHYQFWVGSPQPTGGQPYFGLASGVSNLGEPLIQGGGNQSIPFTLFEACIGIAQGISDPFEEDLLQINSADGVLRVWRKDNEGIGHLEIYDLQGRMIFSKYLSVSNEQIDLSANPPGIYVIRLGHTNGSQTFLLK